MKPKKSVFLGNLKFTAKNLYKQWRIFYRSSYGKVGFYIVLVFVVIALLAPIIVHGNPFATIPSEDYFTPVQELSHALNFSTVSSTFGVTATQYVPGGSYYLFATGFKNGGYGVYAISTKNASSKLLFGINGKPIAIRAFSAYSATTLLPQDELMVSTNHSIYLSHVECSYNPEKETSSIAVAQSKNISVNYTIQSVFVSTKTYNMNPPSGFVGQFLSKPSIAPASYIYTLLKNSTGNYVNAYLAYDLGLYWSHKIPFIPTNLYFYGNEFVSTNYGRVLITGGHNLLTLYYNGTEAYNKTFSYDLTDLTIPSFYQSNASRSNTAFMSIGNKVYQLYIENGTEKLTYVAPATISAIGTSSGSLGFPGNVIIAQPSSIIVLSANNTSNKLAVRSITLPFSINNILYYQSGTFLLSNTTDGDMIYLINAFLQYPFSWHLVANNAITHPFIFVNPWGVNNSLQQAPTIALLANNKLEFYSFEGKARVLPPTMKTLSGLSLPLGMNNAGNNMFVIFIDSFPTDLEVGFAAGIITILISVIVSMVIGYYSGVLSAFWESLSLAIFLIPGLPLFIVLATVLGPTLINLILIFSLLGWPFVTFSLIGLVRSIKTRTFVESAVVSNLSTSQILRRHILPNMGTLLAYLTSINIGGAVAAVSTYEILGLAPLTIPTWGGMLNGFLGDYYGIAAYPWIYIPALVALTLFILAFVFISRGIDELANPRLGGHK